MRNIYFFLNLTICTGWAYILFLITNIYYKKTMSNTNRNTCWSVLMCCKKTWVTLKKRIPRSFLVINVCNQGKNLCSHTHTHTHAHTHTHTYIYIYICIYCNHFYVFLYSCIILREFQSCIPLKLHSFDIIKISLKIIRLKCLYGYR
jgi:hypothetical protein